MTVDEQGSEVSNPSDERTFRGLFEERIARRAAMRAGLGSAMVAFTAGTASLLAPRGAVAMPPLPASTADAAVLPPA